MRHGRLEALRARPRYETPLWRLHEVDGLTRFEFFVLREPRWQPLLVAEVSRDWSEGTLTFDPARVPEQTLAAPIASPFGELALMGLVAPHGLYVHASAARWSDGGVDVFLGQSGAGKTTLAGVALAHGASILSDDRTVLRIENGRLFAYGTPFHGTGRHWSTQRGPVRGLYFLEQSPTTGTQRLPQTLAAARLASLCFTKFWERAAVERTLELCGQAVVHAAAHVLRFRPDVSALHAVESAARAA